jgi:tRNA_anti-like
MSGISSQRFLLLLSIAGIGLWIILFTVFLIWARLRLQNHRPLSGSDPAIKVSVRKLVAECRQNPVATIQKYQGRLVETEGVIVSMENRGSHFQVILSNASSEWSPPRISVRFNAPATVLANHDVGSEVRVWITVEHVDSSVHAVARGIEKVTP